MILRWDEERLAFMKDASEYNAGYYTALWQAVAAQLPTVPQNLCDAGCGAGYLSIEMAKHCKQVTAVDISVQATALLRENAAGLANLTVKTGDIYTLPPEVPYDTMVFCYFGKTPDILKIAKQHCRGTLVTVTRNYSQHRFSLQPKAFDRDTVAYCRSVLEAQDIPYTYAPCDLEFGQPFRSLEAAVGFFTLYGGTQANAEAVLPRLQQTGDAVFPYYLPTVKKMGIFTVQTKDIP